MRGGVSLAVWIGGAMQEIDHLRLDEDFAHHVLGVTRFNRLQVDIITGASAGGLNAALAGMAIAHGTSLACLRKVWMDTADIDSLLDMPRSRARIRSLLNGEYFRLELVRWLEELKSPDDDHPGPDLASADEPSPTVPTRLWTGATTATAGRRWRSSSRPRCSAASPSSRPPTPRSPTGAARPTSTSATSPSRPPSATRVASPRPPSASGGRPAPAPRSRWPSTPSSSTLPPSAAASSSPPARPIPTTLRLFDGGILDNIPVARAIRAAAASPAQEPVRRWVVYLHPSPTLPKPLASETDGSEAPHVVKVVADLLAGRGVETLLDDLEVLREHNREAESQRVQRYSACHAAFEALSAGPRAPTG